MSGRAIDPAARAVLSVPFENPFAPRFPTAVERPRSKAEAVLGSCRRRSTRPARNRSKSSSRLYPQRGHRAETSCWSRSCCQKRAGASALPLNCEVPGIAYPMRSSTVWPVDDSKQRLAISTSSSKCRHDLSRPRRRRTPSHRLPPRRKPGTSRRRPRLSRRSAAGRLVTEERQHRARAHPVHPRTRKHESTHRCSRFRRRKLDGHRDRLHLWRGRHRKKCKVKIIEGAIPPVQSREPPRILAGAAGLDNGGLARRRMSGDLIDEFLRRLNCSERRRTLRGRTQVIRGLRAEKCSRSSRAHLTDSAHRLPALFDELDDLEPLSTSTSTGSLARRWRVRLPGDSGGCGHRIVVISDGHAVHETPIAEADLGVIGRHMAGHA